MLHAAKVCVIGAGPCGLAACKALSEFGIAYDCLDAREDVGGLWNVREGGGGYRSLHSNTSNPNMAYADFPFQDDDPAYLSAADMVRYFSDYADQFDLRGQIELGRRVERVQALSNGHWHVHLDAGEVREYATLVVAAGQYSEPHRPHATYPGTFSGTQLHVHDYFDVSSPVDLRNKRVLVVGLGTSAAEIAAELSDPDAPRGHASQVLLSARSGRWVLPKMIDGVPLDGRAEHVSKAPPALLRCLPPGVGNWLMRRMLGKSLRGVADSLGGAAGLGLPEPTIAPWAERPTLSLDFIPALQAGRIDVRPAIDRFEGPRVCFTDGTEAEVDVVLYATGYGMGLPFLDSQTLGCKSDDLSLYRRIAHPAHDSLFFIGYCRVMCSLWPVAEQQSRWLARLLCGHFTLPDTPTRARKADSLRHSLPVMCSLYVEELRRDAGGL